MKSQPAWPPCPRSSLGALQEPGQGSTFSTGTQHKALMVSMDPSLTVRANEIQQLSSEGCDNSSEPSGAAKAGRTQGLCIMHEGKTHDTDSQG